MSGNKNAWRLVLGGVLAFSLFSHAQQTTTTTSALIQQPGYQTAWQKMVKGQKNLPNWARRGNGTSVPAEHTEWRGNSYLVGRICKPHDCGRQFLIAAFSEDKKSVWGVRVAVEDQPEALYHPSKFATYQWLGKPDDNLKALLMKSIESDPNWQ